MISQSQALEKTQRLLSIVVAASRRSCIHKIASKNGDAFIRAIIEQSFTVVFEQLFSVCVTLTTGINIFVGYPNSDALNTGRA